jgi:hypothetical protein
MKINPLFIIVALLMLACCKVEEPVVVEAPLPVGQWNILSVDSGNIPVVPHATFQFRKSLNLTGKIEFKENGSGELTGEADLISCTNNYFSWVHTDSLNNLYLIFNDNVEPYSHGYLCKSIIRKMQKDTLILDYQDWCRGGNMITGVTIYYRITAVK